MPGIEWPAIPNAAAATVLAMVRQLEGSQWLDGSALLTRQLRQLQALTRHAHESVPWYRRTWQDSYDPRGELRYEDFARLPLLTRRDLQEGFDALRCASVPAAHGAVEERRTSGSTAAPVRFLATRVAGLFWNAFTLRDHLWHRRDMHQKLAVIRRESERGRAANWGPATLGVVATGPTVAHSIREDAGALLDWLREEAPGYLFTYPSLVTELARLSIDRDIALPGLLEVRTLAESVSPDTRALCRAAWGVPLTDLYSASETGYIALQCPDHDNYHVMAEGVLVEVLDEHGKPCSPGEVGRVVVTPLHAFAMPLIRYDIGDYAEVGEPCPCGRGLPVLRRILGRVRNTLVTADGRRFWPIFGTQALMDAAPLQQYQFVQTTPTHVEARIVAKTPLSAEQEALLRDRVVSMLPAGMVVTIVYRDRIDRSASGKFEEFVSEVSTAQEAQRGRNPARA